MKCPNCGSENMQFATNTSGSGYSAGNGCCGFILLGPIGLLCGACGSDITTDEFWVCQHCGSKFTNKDIQRSKEIEQQNRKNYELNKLDADKALKEYGSKQKVRELMNAAAEVKDKKIGAFNEYVDNFVKSHQSDPLIAKKFKLMQSKWSAFEMILAVLLVIFTIILFVGGVPGYGVLGILSVIVVLSIRPIAEYFGRKKLVRYLVEIDPKIKSLYDEAVSADLEHDKYSTLLEKIKSCERYEKNNNL